MSQHALFGYESDSIELPAGLEYRIRHNAAPVESRIALHYHNHYEMFYSISGNTLYAVEGTRYPLDVGTLLLIAPYELHQPCSRSGVCERIALRFQTDLPNRLLTDMCNFSEYFCSKTPNQSKLIQLDSAKQEELRCLLDSLLREQLQQDFGAPLAEHALLTQIFLLLVRSIRCGADEPHPADSTERLVQQIAAYIEQNYASKITLDDLEKQFYTSRYQISREFSRVMGCPPHQYLQQKRLLHAQQMIRQGIPPQQASLQCGFGDYANFYRQFHSAYGVSPREYRRKIPQNSETSDR